MTELLVLFAGIDIPDSRKMENNSKQQKTKKQWNGKCSIQAIKRQLPNGLVAMAISCLPTWILFPFLFIFSEKGIEMESWTVQQVNERAWAGWLGKEGARGAAKPGSCQGEGSAKEGRDVVKASFCICTLSSPATDRRQHPQQERKKSPPFWPI